MRKAKPVSVFYWVDSEGLPLEIVIAAFRTRGWTLRDTLVSFLIGALQAGWKVEKVKSDIREARFLLDEPLPKSFGIWAKG